MARSCAVLDWRDLVGLFGCLFLESVMTSVLENIALIVLLMLLGMGATWAVLTGLIYFFEVTDND
jgi:hypothetical protein